MAVSIILIACLFQTSAADKKKQREATSIESNTHEKNKNGQMKNRMNNSH